MYPFDWSKVPDGEPEIAHVSEDGHEYYGLAAVDEIAAAKEREAAEVRDHVAKRRRHHDPLNAAGKSAAYGVECAREARQYRRRACETRLRLMPPRAIHRTAPRPRGAGRPRAAASRSSSRSGDGGGDGPGEPPAPPALADAAGAPPLTPPARLTIREVRAKILHDLLVDRPLKVTAGQLLGTIRGSYGWTDEATRLAVADLLVDGRVRIDIWGRVEVVA